MRTDEIELRERLRRAQEIRIGDGAVHHVIRGELGLREALKRDGGEPGTEVRDTSGYDPVLRWHSRT